MLIRFSPFHRNGRNFPAFSSKLVPLMLILLLIVGALTLQVRNMVHAAPVDSLVPFRGTVPTIIKQSKLAGLATTNQTLSLSIGLRLRNADALKGYVADINRPKSVNYHRYLKPAQFIGVFAPSKATQDAVLKYLQTSGFTITATYSNRLLITFKGPLSLVEQVFHVTINNYVASNGQLFYANTTDPLLPSSLVGEVQSLDGLNNALYWQHIANAAHSIAGNKKGIPLAVSCLGHASGYFTPDQITAGYNLNGLYNQGYHGEGQTVALFELNSFQLSDITAYESCYGHSHTNIQTIVTGPDPIPADKGMIQVQSDAELVLSAAPSLGTLKIYEAGTKNSVVDYNAEWTQIVQDAPPVVSTSWTRCEKDVLLLDPHELDQENTFFTAAAAQGQSIFSASSNGGSSGCFFDGQSDTTLNAGDPAAQPFVTGVGGTTLSLNSNGSYSSETTWNNPVVQNKPSGASGGGISQKWPIPSWQSAPGVNNSFSTGTVCSAPSGQICREVPDVALNSDYFTGYPVYCTASAAGCSSSNPWLIVGGTGIAAPLWAALMALTNEESEQGGGFNIGFVNPLLYQIASGASYSKDFHDITTGNNDYKNLQAGKYPATPVYDLATGLGSYNAANLAADLVALTLNNSGWRSAPANTNWYFAEGAVGSGFTEFITLQNPDPSNVTNVTVTYFLQKHTPSVITVVRNINPSSRFTENVNNDLGVQSTSTNKISVATFVHVNTGPPLLVERPMYFNFIGIQSGTDTIGAPFPANSYYFAEASSLQSGSAKYTTFVSILNPGGFAATVTLTYYTGSCGAAGQGKCPTEVVTVGPQQRLTPSPGDVGLHQKVAISVSSNQPIVAERPMYFMDNIPNAGGAVSGAASQLGVTAPGTDWLFAEGFTGTNFQEYLELANFGANAANSSIKLEYTDGSTQVFPVQVPAFGQVQFDVNAHPGATTAVSAEVTSDNPIVADRLMFFHATSAHFQGGTDVIGAPAAANVCSFAEGFTGGSFQEYLTLQNPTNTNETVAVTFFINGLIFQQQINVNAHSRNTVNVNSTINPIAQGAVSITAQAISPADPSVALFVAERVMYFGFGTDQGGTDVIGYPSH
jgi:Pro-kumamolisin, activation domain